MYKPASPWISQLNRQGNHKILEKDQSNDIAVIGGGISGVATAYYILKETDRNIVLLESFKLGHGATGHNAGQVVGYFEKEFTQIIHEFGIKKAVEAQKDINSGWSKLEEIIDYANLQVPFSKFIGYAGCCTHEQLMSHLEKKLIRDNHGIQIDAIFIDNQYLNLHQIPLKYHDLFELVDQSKIQELLNVSNDKYIACLATHKGVLNSSLFCEELIAFMLTKYAHRFQIFEYAHVDKINLYQDKVTLEIISEPETVAKNILLEAQNIVLCTNGYKNFTILNHNAIVKDSIEQKLKQNLIQTVGYMGAFLEKTNRSPMAISYFAQDNSDAYFYLTRRKYEHLKSVHTLTCVGGPEKSLDSGVFYDRQQRLKQTQIDSIKTFLTTEYILTPPNLKLDFVWHGLMAYTRNLLRMIGPEPNNRRLMYNLGCNGIGILPSIFGGWKISQYILGLVKTKSVFDPQ